ncbi:uncharacterized protein LOC123412876 [Hordeum vulgare subsp. vulgare]|uniref:uncharacterized protein LOC123412876 n=1 Tax=Hordeum vulgare subsp. vulgare TaxID=112509 RepID=UPI001D1A3E01|nr:uncharacterized protein LOC123412876 [Hordeum vulgare subsp. vulgare]
MDTSIAALAATYTVELSEKLDVERHLHSHALRRIPRQGLRLKLQRSSQKPCRSKDIEGGLADASNCHWKNYVRALQGSTSSTLLGHTQCVSSVAWPEQRTIYSVSWDQSVRQWDAQTGRETWNMDVLQSQRTGYSEEVEDRSIRCSSFVVTCEHMKFFFLLLCFHEAEVVLALFKLILEKYCIDIRWAYDLPRISRMKYFL